VTAVPLAPFAAEIYCRDLRDRTAGAPPGSAREFAWLWACAALDVRCDHLLIPVLVTPADLPLLDTLDRRNRERAWGLPPDYFRVRLQRGGCVLAVETPAAAPAEYPRCPAVLA
jgi:hypothetical protein